MSNLLTFQQVLDKANKPHLLLGNGFSMAYDQKRFSYTTLLGSAIENNIIKKEDALYALFQELTTADFESIMKILDESGKVLEVYKGDKKIIEQLKEDSTNLKNYLVTIITNNHPLKSTDLTEEQKKSCIKFLNPFEKIYTINYDLLLYWATMQDKSMNFTDGYGNTEDSVHEGFVVYKNSGSFNVHYLHGALHYFDDGDEIIKKTYNNSDIDLIAQIKKSLNSNIYPIFISEGNSEQKLTKIIHNSYLNHCYRSLRSLGGGGKKSNKGDLVVFGTYLKKNDNHILEALLENNIQNIYMGVSDADKVSHIKIKIDDYNKGKSDEKKKHLHLYGYKTVNIWS
jgi:hypothetical protein